MTNNVTSAIIPRVVSDINAKAKVACGALAEVAELADAPRSGRGEGDLVWVQIPPSAPATVSAFMAGTFDGE